MFGANRSAWGRTGRAGVEGEWTGRAQALFQKQCPEPHPRAIIRSNQQIVFADASKSGEDGGVLEKYASFLDVIVEPAGAQVKIGFQLLPRSFQDFYELPVTGGTTAVPPVKLRLIFGMRQSDYQYAPA
jgi:hypothetical protein